MKTMSCQIVTKDVNPNDPKIKQLFDEAAAAAPSGYMMPDISSKNITEKTSSMLSRKPIKGVCRLCGKIKKLTKEHIPPKSSGNKQRHTNLTLDDWLRDNSDAKHTVEQGGIFGYTLCKSCNSLTGTLYGNEYKKWVGLAKKKIDSFGSGIVPHLNSLSGPFGEKFVFGKNEDEPVMPGAFVRQVLSCMCSLSGSWDLAGRHPAIRRIILEQATEPLPSGMELGMFIFFGPRVRIHGPQLKIDTRTFTWRWVQEIAFPPFAFQFVIASNSPQPGLGLLIDNFTTLEPEAEHCFNALIEMGFGWSPYPGDYRSKAAIESGKID